MRQDSRVDLSCFTEELCADRLYKVPLICSNLTGLWICVVVDAEKPLTMALEVELDPTVLIHVLYEDVDNLLTVVSHKIVVNVYGDVEARNGVWA